MTFFPGYDNLKAMKKRENIAKFGRHSGLYRFFAVLACILLIMGAAVFSLAVYIGVTGSTVLFGIDFCGIPFLGAIAGFTAEYQMAAYLFFAAAILLFFAVLAVGRIGREIRQSVRHEELIVANARLEAHREIERKFAEEDDAAADGDYRYEVYSVYYDNRS